MSLRLSTVVIASFLLTSPVAAQTQLDVGPGTVGPTSPVYGLEVAWDNVMVSTGLKKTSRVAQERAAEARKAAENGNYKAAQKAADNMADIARKAKTDETEGLEKAEAVLQEVLANAPPQAQQGLQTALDSVRQARLRIAEDGGQFVSPEPPREQPNGSQQEPQTQEPNRTAGGQDTGAQQAVEVVSGVTPDRTLDATNYEFSSSSVSVRKGAVIKFVNRDGSHTVTLDTAGIDRTLPEGESVTLRFNEGGTFQVYCRFHGSPGSGMHTDVSVG